MNPVQKPVRYYIVKADDQAVVRSVPVAVSARRRPAGAAEPAPAAVAAPAAGRARVARLMRAAIRRNPRAR